MNDKVNDAVCWICIDGTYHDISNLCYGDPIDANSPCAFMVRRIRASSTRAPRGPKSPYKALFKTLLDNQEDLVESREIRHFLLRYMDASASTSQNPIQIRLSFCSSLSSTSSNDDGGIHNELSSTDNEDQLSMEDDTSFCSEVSDDIDCSTVDTGSYPQFRGAEETWKAFKTGRYTLTKCPDCTHRMVSVDDAAYVVCANCRLVYPLVCSSTTKQYGIGMGFKLSWCDTLLNEKASLGTDKNITVF